MSSMNCVIGRQLNAQVRIQSRELRHGERHQISQSNNHGNYQDRGINQRGDQSLFETSAHSQIRNVLLEHSGQVTAALPGRDRRHVHRREDSLGCKRLGKKCAFAHALPDVL